VAPARSKGDWERANAGPRPSAARNVFAEGSHAYAAARPRYPAALFEWIAGQCERRTRVWDCATGNGQAAHGVKPWFERVCATDVSLEQVARATSSQGIDFVACAAERSPFRDASFDLVTVAQALHWLDFNRFWPEVARVARPGALFAAWGYDGLESTPEVDQRIVSPFLDIVSPFWAANNRILWDGYRDEDIRFPFERLQTPSFALELEWTAAQLIAYIETWSAYMLCLADPIAGERLREHRVAVDELLEPDTRFAVRMPITMVVARIRAAP
jgi:ubiquinone/menaquinone biosynthesis C-methylase UbiE